MEDLAEHLKEHLKCVICADHFGEMLQCYNGHSHCEGCLKEHEFHSKQRKCSICLTKKGWSTNRQMYQLATQCNIRLPCNIDGCDALLPAEDIKEHRRTCKHRLFNCPIGDDDCKPLCFDDLYHHVSQHAKVHFLTTNMALSICLSEMVTYGPRVILFDSRILLLSCFILYDRRCETKMVIKCAEIGYESTRSNLRMRVWHWNMLNNNYAVHSAEVYSTPHFNQQMAPETIVLCGMRNYISENPEIVVLSEQVVEKHRMRPDAGGLNIHELDLTEDCKELYVMSIQFDTLVD